MKTFIYLASQSPRRGQLLDQIGVAYELLVPGDDEDAESIEAVLHPEDPQTYVQRVTQLKLQAAMQRMKRRGVMQAPVLCADTTVAIGSQILGKPQDTDDAIRMLALLSGQTHRVLTAVALGTETSSAAVLSESSVTFCTLSKCEIENYVSSQEPMGKAGAYAIQGRAAAFVSKLSGSYSGIMGLPLYETAQLLNALHSDKS
jgi:septum formation protein